MKNKILIILGVMLLALTACNNSSEDNKYIIVTDNVTINNGGINLSITDGFDWCHVTNLGSELSCYGRESDDECWDKKSKTHANKTILLNRCGVFIDDNNKMFCDMYGKPIFNNDEEEKWIGIQHEYYKCSFENSENDGKYIIVKDNMSLNNGGVNLSITGQFEWCHTTSSGVTILCGLKDSGEECWDYKIDFYVNNIVSTGSCKISIDNNNTMVCEDFSIGILIDDGDEGQSIRLKHEYTQCYFEHNGD